MSGSIRPEHEEKSGGYLGTGNTHSIIAIKDMIFIESEYIEIQKVLITTEEIFLVLEKYQVFLKNDYKSTTPQEFDFSYICEGEEALNYYIESGGSLGEL